jgi:hypothetical protein
MIAQCMGGWCRKRESCAHYRAPEGGALIERICEKGQEMPVKVDMQKAEVVPAKVRKVGKKPNAWTQYELNVLADHYLTGGAVEVSKRINRSKKAIQTQAGLMGLAMIRADWWTAEEDDFLKANYFQKGGIYVSQQLGRSPTAVRKRAVVLGVPADKHRTAVGRYAEQKVKPNPSKKGIGPKMTVVRERDKKASAPKLEGEPIVTADTKVTIAPPFVDRRWLPDSVVRVVDPDNCREWARAASQ